MTARARVQMPKLLEIENTWLNFINTAINADFPNHTVIHAEPNAPRPNKPYLTLKISGPNRVMITDPKKYNAATDKFRFETQRRYNISIQSYGVEHTDVLDEIILGTQDPDLKQVLKDCDIGVELRGNVTDITGLVSTGWEKRGSLDISFLASKIKLTEIEPVESAEISGEIIKEDETKINVNKFTVSEP